MSTIKNLFAKTFFQGFVTVCGLLSFIVGNLLFISSWNWFVEITLFLTASAIIFSFPLNEWIYKKIAKGEDVNLASYPRSDDKLAIENAFHEVKELAKGNGFLRIMKTEEKLVYSISLILMIFSFTMVVISFYQSKYSNLVNWLSISAFSMAIYPIIEYQAKSRLGQKISELEFKIKENDDREMRNKINQILNKVNRL